MYCNYRITVCLPSEVQECIWTRNKGKSKIMETKISRANGDLKSKLHLGKLSLQIFQFAIIPIYFNYKKKNVV